jgi:hypothetical protein
MAATSPAPSAVKLQVSGAPMSCHVPSRRQREAGAGAGLHVTGGDAVDQRVGVQQVGRPERAVIGGKFLGHPRGLVEEEAITGGPVVAGAIADPGFQPAGIAILLRAGGGGDHLALCRLDDAGGIVDGPDVLRKRWAHGGEMGGEAFG